MEGPRNPLPRQRIARTKEDAGIKLIQGSSSSHQRNHIIILLGLTLQSRWMLFQSPKHSESPICSDLTAVIRADTEFLPFLSQIESARRPTSRLSQRF